MFICVDGADGVGKSSVVKLLTSQLNDEGISASKTKEPYGPIRDFFLNNDDLEIYSELLLLVASRIENLEKVVKPAISRGEVVICDRYIFSTIVYQTLSVVNSDTLSKIISIHKLFNILKPDLNFILSLNPEEAVRRISARGGDVNRFDDGDLEYHRNIHEAFINEAKNPHIIEAGNVIIDCNHKSVEEIVAEIKVYLKRQITFRDIKAEVDRMPVDVSVLL